MRLLRQRSLKPIEVSAPLRRLACRPEEHLLGSPPAMTTPLVYDLAMCDDRRPSPFCWRVKYALSHKGLAFETVPIGFTDIPTLCGGVSKTVPILDDGGRIVPDSWAIADYLDEAYPERPRLFATPAERALCHFLDATLFTGLVPKVFTICVKDLHDHAQERDRAYFRASREKRLGCTLEEVVAGREARLDEMRAAFEPVRVALRKSGPFLSGDAPGYADYVATSLILWPASVTTLPLFRADDPLLPWLRRVQDLYGGLGRKSPLNPIAV
jgi:glutathione S-transferase